MAIWWKQGASTPCGDDVESPSRGMVLDDPKRLTVVRADRQVPSADRGFPGV